MLKIQYIIICLCSLSLLTSAQNTWTEDIHNQEKSFYEIQQSFEDYWQGKTIEKGKGWKPFKRREYFMEPRVYPNGIFPYEMLFQEWSKLKNQPKNTSSNIIEANWNSFDPNYVPLQNNGNKRGVGRINTVCFSPNNPNIIWVGSPSGGLWKSTDGGQSWSSNTDLLPNLGVSDIVIDPTNENIMYIITGDRDADDTYAYGLMKSLDGGQSWNTTGLSFNINNAYRGNRVLIHPDNSNILLVSTRKSGYGETFRSIDGGENWDMVLQGPNLISMEFNTSNPNIVYAVTTGSSKFYRSNDNGLSWSNVTTDVGLPNSGNNRGIIGVTAANPNVVYVLYSANDDGFGGLYKSVDGGSSFNLQSETPNILSWENDGSGTGGQGWYDLAFTVSPINEDLIFAGGVNIWKSVNGGTDWDISSHWYGAGGVEYAHADQHILKYNPENGILYAGNDGGLYKSENNGTNWIDISDGLQITQYYKIGISQSVFGLALGGAQDNGTLRYNSQNDWNAVRGGDGMECAIDPTDPNIMYSELYYGDIAISTNGGDNWDDISPDSDGGWVTPYQIDQDNPNRIVIGYNIVYESLDYGSNWNAISNEFSSNIDVICLAPSSDDIIYIAEEQNIFKTVNGGESWTNIGNGLPNVSVTSLAVHPTNPNKVWATFSGYSSENKVFFTSNGGESWTNISSNIPNLPVNCILYYNPNETLFIGTDVGVFYIDSTLNDWQVFNQGLPNVIVNELEYHINSNKLFAGTYGRGLWLTSLPATAMPVASFDYSIIDECLGIVSFNNNSLYSSNIYWDFGNDSSSTEYSPIVQFLNDSIYTVRLIAYNELGSDTTYQDITINPIEPPTTISDQSCLPSSLNLSAYTNSSADINWYDAAEGGNLLQVGENFTTPLLNTSTTYYVSTAEIVDSAYIGELNHFGDSEYSSSENSVGGIVFNAITSFILESVDVYTNLAGERKIILLDDQGNTIQEHTEFVTQSENVAYTINLNFQISAGQNYILTTDNDVSIANFGGTNPKLKRINSNDLSFPYTFDNTASLTNSFWFNDGGQSFTNYYYYFYNWKIKKICSSIRTPVQANIGSNESLTIEYDSNCNYDSIVLNAVGNFDSYQWSDQSSSPQLTVYEANNYSVTAYDSSNCIATASVEIPYINTFNILSQQTLCEGSSIYLQCNSGFNSYLWSNGDTISAISINLEGQYSVTATDANGCTLFDDIIISSQSPMQVEIETELDSLIVCQGSTVNFNVSDNFSAGNVIWNNNDIGLSYSQSFNLIEDAIIEVSAFDENLCLSSDSLTIKVIDCASSIIEFLSNTQLFPNPNEGKFTIQHQSDQELIKYIRILDTHSRLIQNKTVRYYNGLMITHFDLSQYSPGIYFVELNTTIGKSFKKIILE